MLNVIQMIQQSIMENISLFIAVIIAFVISAVLLHRFGDWKKQNALVIVAVLISWYFSILTVFVLPLDIASTLYKRCTPYKDISMSLNITSVYHVACSEPWGYVSLKVLYKFWHIIYWSSQFLTWVLLPLMQSYTRAGDFTFHDKLRSAVRDNIYYYASYLFLFLVCFLYLISQDTRLFNQQKLKAVASSASNTWGLFLLIILLGYAFVDVPRKLWLDGTPETCLQRGYFQLSKLCTDYEDSEMELKNIIQKIYVIESQLNEDSPLMVLVRKIFTIIPVQFHKTMLKYQVKRSNLGTSHPSVEMLVKCNKQLKQAIHIYKRNEIQRMRMFEDIFKLQRIVSDRKGEFQNDFSFTSPNRFTEKWWRFIFEYYWEAITKPGLMKVISILSAILSVAVISSEVTFFNTYPVLSIFAIITTYAKEENNYLLTQGLCAIVIAYMCYCAYSTVFKIKLFNYYHFAPEHHTDENSLIFSGMLLSRLTPPLCLNFLGLIHLDSHIIRSHLNETQYTQVMGHMDVISIISNGFNIYFPMVMLIFSVTTYFNIGSIILSAVGFHQYIEDSEITEDTIADGQRRAAAEKEHRYRRKGLLAADELQQQYCSSNQDIIPTFTSSRFNSDRVTRENRLSGTRFNSHSYEMDVTNVEPDSKISNVPSRNIFDDV